MIESLILNPSHEKHFKINSPVKKYQLKHLSLCLVSENEAAFVDCENNFIVRTDKIYEQGCKALKFELPRKFKQANTYKGK